MLNRIIDLLYPPCCLVCDKTLTPHSSRTSNDVLLCDDCNPGLISRFDLAGLADRLSYLRSGAAHRAYSCERCGEPTTPLPAELPLCVACQVWAPPLRYIRSLWRYANSIEEIIKALKYRGKRPLAKYLGSVAAHAIKQPAQIFPAIDWDLIVPIPSSLQNLRQRSFSHTALLAKHFAIELDIPYSYSALQSSRLRMTQVSLARESRMRNVEDAFRVKEKLVSGKRILLIDDMMTTGATLWNTAWNLLESGAMTVDGLTIARSRQFQSLRLVSTNTCSVESVRENQRLANS